MIILQGSVHTYIRESGQFLCHVVSSTCGLRGCKNRPAPFPGQMSYKAT